MAFIEIYAIKVSVWTRYNEKTIHCWSEVWHSAGKFLELNRIDGQYFHNWKPLCELNLKKKKKI